MAHRKISSKDSMDSTGTSLDEPNCCMYLYNLYV